MAGRVCLGERVGGLAGLAATDSSAAGAAVPWALRVFTAEFGMGSGVWPLAMATRPAKLPVGDCAGEGEKCLEAAWGLALHAGGGAARLWPRWGSSRSSD